ncbi:GNAT family N-acetyltransferase [Massilia sp.]|uniref:GNAT family N-acetyltransferase n=1 Tax=Massilia sp. TaxID=1882437 RepID=UPI0028B11D22|nr:GNAT family N-acetyltransferase [Massilia sp.]
MNQELQLRPMHPGDEAFLRRVYAEVRAPEIALFGWDAASAEGFLHMQFNAQHHHYQNHYPQARFDIVERAGEPLGRLYVDRSADEIHVIDVALLAQYRGQGIGTILLRSLQEEAAHDGRRLVLQVEQHNPAQALYLRLGFTETDFHGMHRTMQWLPALSAAPSQNQ